MATRSALAGDPVDPTVSNTQLVIGDCTWDIDLNKDPLQEKTAEPQRSPPVGEQDPLEKQVVELSTAAAASGSARRNTIHRDGPPSSVESRKDTDNSLSMPTTTTSASAAPRDFCNSAEMVVGSYALAQAPSRSASPNPPRAVLAGPSPPRYHLQCRIYPWSKSWAGISVPSWVNLAVDPTRKSARLRRLSIRILIRVPLVRRAEAGIRVLARSR